MQKSYVLFDNFTSRFQYIVPNLCDTIPEHVFEDNVVNIGWVRGKQEVVSLLISIHFHI